MSGGRETCDVAVIGGGSAGLAAAVRAAREGARTVLLERHGCLGGMGTASLVHTFCGLYLLRRESGAVLANPGIPTEMAERMIAATGVGPVRMGRVDVLPQHPVEFARIADEMVVAEPLIDLQLHTEVIGLSQDGHWDLHVAGRGGLRRIRAASLVDASGDAVAAGFLGSGYELAAPERLQRPAFVFAVNCLAVLDEQAKLHTAGAIIAGIRAGEIPDSAKGLSFRASGRSGEVFFTLDLTGADTAGAYDPLDHHCLTALETEGRKTATQVIIWLAAHSSYWKDAYVRQWPQRSGVRESRRWVGRHVLTGAELLAGTRFDDEIALATWPMEFRENARGPKLRYPEDDRPCGIPLRCLQPLGVNGLHVAGRCISVDHDAQASIRVMGTCFATGEAAGKAAADHANRV